MSEQVWPRGMNKNNYPSPKEWVKLLGQFAEEIIKEAHEGARDERSKREAKRAKRVYETSSGQFSIQTTPIFNIHRNDSVVSE